MINVHAHVHDCLYKIFLGHIFWEWEWVWWPSCLYVRSSIYLHWPPRLWNWAQRHSGVREQEHRAGGVASLCHLCLLNSGFRCVGLAYLLDMCELGCFCAWMCFTGERICISPHPSSLLVHGTHTKMHFLHPAQLSHWICTPQGRCDPSGAQPQVGTHTSPPHPLSMTAQLRQCSPS